MAINATLKVSVDELNRGSRSFGESANETRRTTDRMLVLIDGTNSVWQGEARNTYARQFNGLRDDMNRMYKMIDEYRKDLAEISRIYTNTENQNKAIAGRLNPDAIH